MLFRDRYEFLSNFYECLISYQGNVYLNVESAFQAQKCPEKAFLFQILSGSGAKRLGRLVELRPDWETVKDNIMEQILRIKFANPKLKKLLIDTGDLHLQEDNYWGDKYWGVYQGEGKNILGILLMKIRSEIKQGGSDGTT